MGKNKKTQEIILEYIQKYISEYDIPPTVREIGSAVGLKSTSTVHMHIKNLEKAGLINLSPSKQRSITLNKTKSNCVYVPVVGSVAAGNPILAVENIQEYIPVPHDLIHSSETNDVFMLTVQGDSMIDAGILSGDKIIVNKSLHYSNGTIVVAKIHEENVTVKKLFIEKNNKIRLQPENQNMEPIIVDRKDVEIIGCVVGLIRSY